MNSELPILLLTGYLGSGKTTLVNHILNNRRGIKFAVIVNDIGEVNIDADLIQRGGVVGNDNSGDLVALQNGCICCTLKMDLVQQIYDLTAMKCFDYIVIEASGICEPEPIAQTICSIPFMDRKLTQYATPRLDCICTVVDALRLRDEFSCGDNLPSGNFGEEDIENLIVQQIEFCNIVLLNKASEVDPADLHRIHHIVRALQPEAKIIECDYADVDIDLLLNTHLFNFGKAAGAATWIREIEKPLDEIEAEEAEHHHHHDHDHDDRDDHDDHDEHEHHHHDHDHHDHDDHDHDDHDEHDHEDGHHHHHHHHDGGEVEEYGIGTFVYYRRPAFDLNKFDYFLAKQWPKEIIRAKGICYFSEAPDMSYIFEQAGSQKKLVEAGRWYATAPEEELRRLMECEPGLMRDWDPVYGDRMQKIVIIGQHLDRAKITALLDACLDK